MNNKKIIIIFHYLTIRTFTIYPHVTLIFSQIRMSQSIVYTFFSQPSSIYWKKNSEESIRKTQENKIKKRQTTKSNRLLMCINLQTDLDVKCWGLFSTVFYNSLFFSFFSLSLLFLPPSHCLYSMSTRCDSDSFLLLFWWSLIGLGTPEAVNEAHFQSLFFFLFFSALRQVGTGKHVVSRTGELNVRWMNQWEKISAERDDWTAKPIESLSPQVSSLL